MTIGRVESHAQQMEATPHITTLRQAQDERGLLEVPNDETRCRVRRFRHFCPRRRKQWRSVLITSSSIPLLRGAREAKRQPSPAITELCDTCSDLAECFRRALTSTAHYKSVLRLQIGTCSRDTVQRLRVSRDARRLRLLRCCPSTGKPCGEKRVQDPIRPLLP